MSRPLRVSICPFAETGPGPKDRLDMERLDRALRMAARARDEGAQLAVFPEYFLLVGYSNHFCLAEPLDGPVFSRIARAARELDLFLAVNHPTLIDDKRYNTTVLFNRAGKIEGLYHKVYPTMYEMRDGCTPGQGPVVLDTEIGRLGFATCFDLNFEPLRRGYVELDPDVILFNSYYRGGLQTRLWAFETRCHMVCSIIDPGSRIVNPVGRVLKFTDIIVRQLTHTLELDCEVLHLDGNMNFLDQLRHRFGRQVDVDCVEAEGIMLLSATGPTPLSQIMREMNFCSARDYFKQSSQMADQARRQAAAAPAPSLKQV